jgi:hypothetical protein
MSGYQFLHVETYALTSSNNKNVKHKKLSASEVISELLRETGSCPHVPNPKPAELIHGCSPTVIIPELINLSKTNRDPLGRAIRKDGQLLLAGVCSYPHKLDSSDFNKNKFDKWISLTIEFLVAEYGDSYRCSVLHTDETYPHIHFYAIPPSINGQVHIKSIHCGMNARDTVPDKGKNSGKIRSNLYRGAMRSYQDRYHSCVGSKCALTRLGPAVTRMTRQQWHYSKKNAELLSQSESRLSLISAKETQVASKQLSISKKEVELKQTESNLTSNLANSQVEREELSRLESSIEWRELLVGQSEKLMSSNMRDLSLREKELQLYEQTLLKREQMTETVNNLEITIPKMKVEVSSLEAKKTEIDNSIIKSIAVSSSSIFSSSKLNFLSVQYQKLKLAYNSLKSQILELNERFDKLNNQYLDEKKRNERLSKDNDILRKSLDRYKEVDEMNVEMITKLKSRFSKLLLAFKNNDRSYLIDAQQDKKTSLDELNF